MEEAPASDGSFQPKHIPINVWNEVLQFVPSSSLKNLALVCKYFNKLIGTSEVAMDRLYLCLKGYTNTNYNFQAIQKSQRNYNSMALYAINIIIRIPTFVNPLRDQKNYKLNLFQSILDKFGTTLKVLKISNCCLKEDELVILLKLSHLHLETLYLSFERFTPEQNTPKNRCARRNFKLTKLKTLYFDYTHQDLSDLLLGILPDSIHKISFKCNNSSVDTTKYSQIFEMQKEELKHLKLSIQIPYDYGPKLNIIDHSKIQFKLETLDVFINHCFRTKRNGSFHKFLEAQAESLKKFKLMCRSVHHYYSVFESMPKLEKLEVFTKKIHGMEHPQSFNCPSLKTLSLGLLNNISVSSCFDFIKRFPDSIEEIEFKRSIPSKLMEMITKKFKNLKKLTIHEFNDLNFRDLHLDNVTELQIYGLDAVDSYYEDNEDPDTDMEYVLIALENLEVLKLGRFVPVTLKYLFWVLGNFQKLKHLEIEDGIGLENLCKISHYFKNLKYLKISHLKDTKMEEFKDSLRQFPGLNFILRTDPAPVFDDSIWEFSYSNVDYEDDFDTDYSSDDGEDEDD